MHAVTKDVECRMTKKNHTAGACFFLPSPKPPGRVYGVDSLPHEWGDCYAPALTYKQHEWARVNG